MPLLRFDVIEGRDEKSITKLLPQSDAPMRLIAFILFSGIALASMSACAPVSGNTGTLGPTGVNTTECPTLEGYPDCQP
ncbi:MAG TPA: hypothetical protein VGB82_28430 [Alphaproteobacteria bacterium]